MTIMPSRRILATATLCAMALAVTACTSGERHARQLQQKAAVSLKKGDRARGSDFSAAYEHYRAGVAALRQIIDRYPHTHLAAEVTSGKATTDGRTLAQWRRSLQRYRQAAKLEHGGPGALARAQAGDPHTTPAQIQWVSRILESTVFGPTPPGTATRFSEHVIAVRRKPPRAARLTALYGGLLGAQVRSPEKDAGGLKFPGQYSSQITGTLVAAVRARNGGSGKPALKAAQRLWGLRKKIGPDRRGELILPVTAAYVAGGRPDKALALAGSLPGHDARAQTYAMIGLAIAHEGPAGQKKLADRALAKAESIADNVPIPHREFVYLNAASARALLHERKRGRADLQHALDDVALPKAPPWMLLQFIHLGDSLGTGKPAKAVLKVAASQGGKSTAGAPYAALLAAAGHYRKAVSLAPKLAPEQFLLMTLEAGIRKGSGKPGPSDGQWHALIRDWIQRLRKQD
ncbi:MAG TPA: hypothetical protein VFA86_11675 [Gammaproteobacteria bacterium]|nr:hypothetical protein [Gammaproteobacteria bacterium]